VLLFLAVGLIYGEEKATKTSKAKVSELTVLAPAKVLFPLAKLVRARALACGRKTCRDEIKFSFNSIFIAFVTVWAYPPPNLILPSLDKIIFCCFFRLILCVCVRLIAVRTHMVVIREVGFNFETEELSRESLSNLPRELRLC
jgi:hypothetical protein